MAQPENGIAAPTAVTGSFYHRTDIPGLEATRPACRATVPRPWRRLGQSDHPGRAAGSDHGWRRIGAACRAAYSEPLPARASDHTAVVGIEGQDGR